MMEEVSEVKPTMREVRFPLPNKNTRVEKDLPQYYKTQLKKYENMKEFGLVTSKKTYVLDHLKGDLHQMLLWYNKSFKKTPRSKTSKTNDPKNIREIKLEDIVASIIEKQIFSVKGSIVDTFKEFISIICAKDYFDDITNKLIGSILTTVELSNASISSDKENQNMLNVADCKPEISIPDSIPDSQLSSSESSIDSNTACRENDNVGDTEKKDSASNAESGDNAEMEDHGSMYREDSSSSISSGSSTVQESTDLAKKINPEVVWMHRPRLPVDKVETHCFVCQSEYIDSGEPLSQCARKGTKCSTRFHMSCVINDFKTYNAGDFNMEYMKTLVGGYVCPLHHCDLCWFERKKHTAILGRVYECAECYRAFHDLCRPAGSVVTKVRYTREKIDGMALEYSPESVVCHAHSRENFAKALASSRGHLPFCCECEDRGKEDLLRCSQCIRSYHMSCRRVKKILGSRYNDTVPICESCIHGESIRVNQSLIAKYNTGFFACTSVSLLDYPQHCRTADKHGRQLFQPGFIAVRWAGCQNLFSLLPSITLVPMFHGSFALLGKKKKDKDYYDAWKIMDENIIVPRPVFDLANERYLKIKTSVYHPDCPKPRLLIMQEEDVMCDCEEEEGRCNSRSKCQNRGTHQECPDACERKKGGCSNRYVSRKETHPKIRTDSTNLKGMGVFATADIPAGDFIAEYAGEIISLKEQQRRIEQSSICKNDEEKHYMMQLDKGRVIDCKYKGNVARFLNHSCDPNCVVETIEAIVGSQGVGRSSSVRYDKRVAIFTKRDVKAGEELCFNYDMTEYSVGTPLPECHCNAANCTGKLGRSEMERKESKMLERKKIQEEKKKKKKRQISPAEQSSKRVKQEKKKRTLVKIEIVEDEVVSKPEVKTVTTDFEIENNSSQEVPASSSAGSTPRIKNEELEIKPLGSTVREENRLIGRLGLMACSQISKSSARDEKPGIHDAQSSTPNGYLPKRATRGRTNKKFSP